MIVLVVTVFVSQQLEKPCRPVFVTVLAAMVFVMELIPDIIAFKIAPVAMVLVNLNMGKLGKLVLLTVVAVMGFVTALTEKRLLIATQIAVSVVMVFVNLERPL